MCGRGALGGHLRGKSMRIERQTCGFVGRSLLSQLRRVCVQMDKRPVKAAASSPEIDNRQESRCSKSWV